MFILGIHRGDSLPKILYSSPKRPIKFFFVFGPRIIHCYKKITIKRCAALLPRRGPHIASHSVCLSVCLSVPWLFTLEHRSRVFVNLADVWYLLFCLHVRAAYSTAISAAQARLILIVVCRPGTTLYILTPKSTPLRDSAHFEPSCVKIGQSVWYLRVPQKKLWNKKLSASGGLRPPDPGPDQGLDPLGAQPLGPRYLPQN